MEQDMLTVNPAPTGEPFDPFGFGANYLGNSVTIRGANGYSVTGRAILDFGGIYPSPFESHTTRHLLSGQATYRMASWVDLSGGIRYEREDGFTAFDETSRSESVRHNEGAFAEARAAVRRLHLTAGIGVDHNAVYKRAVSPRLSVAAYVRDPSSISALGDTKVIFNVGKGIKAPAIFQELSSLFALVPPEQAVALGIDPIGPERARNLDAGIEQGLWQDQLRVRATLFHNTFSDLIEFVSAGVLPRLGFSKEAATATGFGAYVNSQSYRARGVETSAEAAIGPQVRVVASYTFLDADVIESLSSGALAPAVNPAFPGIEIGAFEPLIGARPFRRPTHSGSLLLSYTQGRGQIALAGYFSGKRDDSTFLSDAFFGNSMLLPNKDLDAAYQKFDISGAYTVHPRLRWYVSIENVGGGRYQAVAGFPALPGTFRSGVSVLFGNTSATP
jgi:iron complex outermembrane receptor protein/vitamin B12 transporter